MNVLHIQYTGDFKESYERLVINHGKENYYGQRYSVNVVVEQARRGLNVLVLVLKSDGYRAQLEPNLESIGLNWGHTDYQHVQKIIDDFSPDRVILRVPDVKILRYLRKKKILVLPNFADSFEYKSILKGRLYRFQLAYELKQESIRWVANHQINAALSIRNLGIRADKILAYDWEHDAKPEDWRKTIPSDLATKPINLFYAGMISEAKGVLDLIEAVKYVRESGRLIQVRLAGRGYDSSFDEFAKKLNIRDCLEFLGLIDHDEILTNMNAADLVVVPSRHSYPEGLPMTIMEALMVHTPVVASDHPMFVGRVGKRGAVQFFHERDALDLAKQIISVCGNLEEYRERCINAPREWHDICLDFKWGDMVNAWIDRPMDCDFSASTIDKLVG
jgi:glycosyltransferase involved in cell wall biosynthesis